MTTTTLSDDALVTVLLCSRLGTSKANVELLKPLLVEEWNRLAQTLMASSWQRPRALLGQPVEALQEELGLDEATAVRIAALLDRGGQVAIELERLQSRGIWLLTRADDAYPIRLKSRLKSKAPPVLFGAGPVALLDGGGVAVVGSRDVDAAGEAFAEAIGRRCAENKVTVISGGARGVDRLAMTAAVERGGYAVGVLADSLERWLRDVALRQAIHDDRITLVTPFKPDAGFDVGNAMGRNRLIYCLAQFAIVVASSAQKGGTRAGALENLRHEWAPLFVRAASDMPDGNRDLIERGGLAFAPTMLDAGTSLVATLEDQVGRAAGRQDRPLSMAGSRRNDRQLSLLEEQAALPTTPRTRRS